jgi:Rrf2 family nitric oxide-sensitive transcriptional repressor
MFFVNLRLQTDYSLRVLLYLAHLGKQVSVDEIAAAYNISKDHLFKVVQQLSRLGYVQSKPGRNGGVRLVKDPAEINIGAVVTQVEGRNGVLECIPDPTTCALEPGCLLRHLLIDAESAFFNVLSTMTIADVIKANTDTKKGGVFNLTVHGGKAVAAANAAAAAGGTASIAPRG